MTTILWQRDLRITTGFCKRYSCTRKPANSTTRIVKSLPDLPEPMKPWNAPPMPPTVICGCTKSLHERKVRHLSKPVSCMRRPAKRIMPASHIAFMSTVASESSIYISDWPDSNVNGETMHQSQNCSRGFPTTHSGLPKNGKSLRTPISERNDTRKPFHSMTRH